MKPKKLKQCKGEDCEQMFSPYNTLQKYCGPKCRPKAVRKVRKKTSVKGVKGKAKKKYKRKSKYAIAKSTVDRKWAEVVRNEAGKCALCPKTTGLQAHHVISRSNHAVRWNLNNGVALCALHHTFGNKLSAHKTPIDFAIAMLEQRGQAWYDNLRVAARFPDAMNRDDANTMLTNRLKGIKDDGQTDKNRFGS
jgi:5-methylcytosine-specific restriction endonuclease McrA